MLNSARAVQGIGAAIMFAVSLALLAHAFPSAARARRRAGRLRRRDRRLVRGRPARRRRCSPAASTGSGSSSSTCRSALFCLWITRTYVEESRDPHCARDRLAGPDHAHRRPVPARARAAARQRGRLGLDADRRRAGRRRGRADRLRARRAARARADAADAAVPRRDVHGRADRRLRDLGVVLRALPLHDAVPAADPRPVGDRGRPRLPARHAADARRLRRHRAARREGAGAHDDRRRPRAGRRRHGPVHAGRRDLVVAGR